MKRLQSHHGYRYVVLSIHLTYPPPPQSISHYLRISTIRLLNRHGCSEQGGSYVNYPAFVSSFTASVRGAEPASAVAAVAAGSAAASAAAAAAAAKKASATFSGMVSKPFPVKRKQEGGEPVRR